MRVLWVCNIMLPAAARALGVPYSVREGWLTGILDRLLAADAGTEGLPELGVCFPAEGELAHLQKKIRPEGSSREIACYGFAEDLVHPEEDDVSLELRFGQILADFRPDLVHIFGTEFAHAYACAKVWNRPERTLVGIQGLCGAIAEEYMADLPERVQRARTLRDVLRSDSLQEQQQKFRLRGAREKKLLQLAGHVTGRTEFDRRETAVLQPKARYHRMNETMRSSFYEGRWDPAHCRRGQIFLSQGDYPLKGFHYLLQALAEVRKECPQVNLVVAGNSILGNDGLKSRLKIPAYGAYLRRLIREGGLEGCVQVTGRMEEEEMKRTYLRSHLVVCPSALENSPNSVAEAMLLGVPVIASRAGGIPSLIRDGVDGLLFPKGDVQALADRICRILKDDALARRLSEEAAKQAAVLYDGEENFRRLLEIYEAILGKPAADRQTEGEEA